MEDNLTIWSPVMLNRLKDNRRLTEERSYPLEYYYRAIEDLRIRVKERQVVALGTAVEARIKVDILCLLADQEGHMQLFKREEVLNDRIPLQEFERTLNRDEPVDYHLELKRVAWEGEINGYDVKVACFIDYTVIATHEQLVRLRGEEHAEVSGEILTEAMRQLEAEIERIQNENAELKKQLFCHTSNISSLKQGLLKAEKRNAALNRENISYQAMIDKLRGEMTALGHAVGFSSPADSYRSYIPDRGEYKVISARDETGAGSKPDPNGLNQLGSRIKRLFQAN
ncbi:MAG: hypothetical protein ACM3PE_06345 [Deltaproteobacteria bacterium]